MKARLANLFWLAVLVLVVGGFIYAFLPPHLDKSGQPLFIAARQSLREQGFKTDLADFDFSTSPELRSREAILKATLSNRSSGTPPDQINLMEIVGANSTIVIWKQNLVKLQSRTWPGNSDEMSWDDFRQTLNENQSALDAACAAAISGPIAFNLDASHGSAMLLPHLAMLKNLNQMLSSRMVLALHDGNQDTAWTNLLAATRLVTAWNPEPAEISHMVRFSVTRLVFNATWQALQANHWPDDDLARLQAEWQSANFFTNLTEAVAFQGASSLAAYDYDRMEVLHPSMPVSEFFRETWPNPLEAWGQFQSEWRRKAYQQGGKYDEEKDLMFFYRDREVERRNAVQAPTWLQMRALPGVTNETVFQSKYNSRVQAIASMRRINMAFQRQGSSFLGRAAEAEAERRILITAIALERYRGKHGTYPQTLDALMPEFLENPLPDFMDGRPLRYRPTDDDHFVLYSVGLDCTDNGGKMRRSFRDMGFEQPPDRNTPPPESDLVWPLPAGAAALQEEQQIQTEAKKVEAKAKVPQQKHYLIEISDREWQQSPGRQPRVANILAMKRPVGIPDPMFKGQSAGNMIRNTEVLGTNQLSLDALLTPKQITTGKEPEDITFELPIRYDSFITNNIVLPIVDADPEEELPLDCGGKVYDRERATNGDCLLVWHAIYDPPGPHAVQVYLALQDKHEGTLCGIGPPIAVTTSNLCQFSLDCVNYDVELGARFHARLPEKNAQFSIECLTTNGAHLSTLSGSTSNGEFNIVWNLVDDQGRRLHGETFNSVVHITLPDSGRTQTLRGP